MANAASENKELRRFLTRVHQIGVGHMLSDEFMLVLERQRVTDTMWAAVHRVWCEVNSKVPLLVGESHDSYAFAYGEGLDVGKDAWFKDVRTKAGIAF